MRALHNCTQHWHDCLYFELAAVFDDFLGHEIPECCDTLRLPEFLGVREEHWNLYGFHVRQNPDELWEVLDHVVGQNADPEIGEHRLQHTEVVVDRERRRNLVGQQLLNEPRSGAHLERGRVLADEAMLREILHLGRGAGRFEVFGRGVEPHPDTHQLAPY